MSRFVVSLFTILIVSPVAFAKQSAQKPICNTAQECRDIISRAQATLTAAQARLQVLNGENESQRVSVTGAVFTRDTSNPKLGEAYRDPSGLIWGSVVTTPQGKVNYMSQDDAKTYCKSIGARLPTIDEFVQLAKSTWVKIQLMAMMPIWPTVKLRFCQG